MLTETILMPFDRGRFVVLHACSRAGADHPRPGGGHEGERAPVVVKCNVGRYHGTIVAPRTVFYRATPC